MYAYHCLNNIAQIGLSKFDDQYTKTEQMADADAVIVRSAAMHEMEFSDNLKCIGRAGAGVNNIPLERCAEEGIVVFNTPGANANGVKEMVIAALLLASRDIIGGNRWVLENKEDANIGKAAEKAKKAYAGNEIEGKKLGVIGLGAIGILVANAAQNLGMEVYGYDPYLSVDNAWKLSRGVKHITKVEDIYKECDYITIHVPAMDSTKGMINKEAVDMMKEGAVLLNFARDILVDEKAVVEALKAGKLKKYVSDFANPVTAGVEGTIVLPHLGASTEESEDNCAIMAVKEVRDYLENGNIKNSVNFPNCTLGVKTENTRITILHKNVPNMIGQFTAILSKDNTNIDVMANKSRKAYAYTMIDTDTDISAEAIKALEEIDGVIRVRVIR